MSVRKLPQDEIISPWAHIPQQRPLGMFPKPRIPKLTPEQLQALLMRGRTRTSAVKGGKLSKRERARILAHPTFGLISLAVTRAKKRRQIKEKMKIVNKYGVDRVYNAIVSVLNPAAAAPAPAPPPPPLQIPEQPATVVMPAPNPVNAQPVPTPVGPNIAPPPVPPPPPPGPTPMQQEQAYQQMKDQGNAIPSMEQHFQNQADLMQALRDRMAVQRQGADGIIGDDDDYNITAPNGRVIGKIDPARLRELENTLPMRRPGPYGYGLRLRRRRIR